RVSRLLHAHRSLPTAGWVEAEQLTADHRVIVGPETPLDDLSADPSERDFRAVFGPFEFTMRTPEARAKTLAFFRLVGYACSDGTYSMSRTKKSPTVSVFTGTHCDTNRVVDDV